MSQSTVTITRTGTTTGAIDVYFQVTGSAILATDYSFTGVTTTTTANLDKISFAPGQSAASFSISALDDNSSNESGSENVTLTLVTPPGGGSGSGGGSSGSYTIGSPSSGTVTISEDDPTVTVTKGGDASEGPPAVNGTFVVTRTGGTSSPLTVNFTTSGTASNPSDYTISASGSVTIPAGSSSATVVVTPGDDSGVETVPENVVLTIAPGGDYLIGAAGTATVAITDPDAALGATGDTLPSLVEGLPYSGEVAEFTAPSGTTPSSATIDWGDGTATTSGTFVSLSGSNYGVNGTHTYAEAGTFAITVTIAVSNGTNAKAVGSATVGDATITYNHPDAVSPTSGIAESTTPATFNLDYLTDFNPLASSADYTVTVNWGDGTPASPGFIVVPPKASADRLDWGVGGNHAYAEEGTYTATVTVVDDDGKSSSGSINIKIGDAPLTASMQTFQPVERQSFSGVVGTIVGPPDPSGDLTTTINWGDGTSSQGTVSLSGSSYNVSGTHTYAEEGTFPASFSVVDDGGNTTGASGSITVVDAPLTASAAAFSPFEGVALPSSTVVASFSDPAPEASSSYSATIDWGDGSAVQPGTISGNSVLGGHTYAEEGAYTVLVTVRDEGGASKAVSQSISVLDAPLHPTGSNQVAVESATATSFPLASFTDDNPNAPLSDFTATINWGDGASSGGVVSGPSGGTFAVSGSHAYADEGVYTTTVTIVDKGGSKATVSPTVTVGDAMLSATGVPVAPVEGKSFTGVVTTFTDALAAPPGGVGDFTASIDWGDGTAASAGSVSLSGQTYSVTGTHTYAEEGAFPVRVTIHDDGGSVGSSSSTATVGDAPLTATVGSFAPVEGIDTGTITVGTFTDQNASAPLSDFSATITWGDNSTSSGTITGSGGSYTVRGHHIYGDEGKYPVSLSISDVGGQTAANTASITVADAGLTATGKTFSLVEGSSTGSATVATFTDANPTATSADFTASIRWGDGTTSSGTISGPIAGVFSVTSSHAYTEEGSNTATITITDDGGSVASTTGTANVADAPLSSTSQSISGTEGVALANVQVAAFSDADTGEGPGETPDDYSASIQWGDGGVTPGTIVSDGKGGFLVTGSYTYSEGNDPGYPYPLTVTILDVSGGSTTTTSTTADISDPIDNTPTVCQTCPTGLIGRSSGIGNGLAGGSSYGPTGVNYGSGAIANIGTAGLGSGGFGIPFGEGLNWTNADGLVGEGANGSGMVDPYLPGIQQLASGAILATITAGNTIWFDPGAGNTYTAKFFGQETLKVDSGTGDFLLTDTLGDVIRFYGFATSLPLAQRGGFESFADPDGNLTSVTAHTADGHIQEVRRSTLQNGVQTFESFLTSYLTTGPNAGLVQGVTWRRSTDNAVTWTVIRQSISTYYDGTQPHGNPRDLQSETIQDGSGNTLDTTYFRYYTPGEAGGYTRGLKYFVSSSSYSRAATALGNPSTATDAQLAPFADAYYQYDGKRRVTEAVLQGTGCSCNGGNGQGTYTYSYVTSTNTPDYNHWTTKTVETLPDGNTNTVYTNIAGEAMLTAFKDVSDPANPSLAGKTWITWEKYDAQGRLIEDAAPSAVTGYDDTKADLLNFSNGTSPYLASTVGVINFYDYGATTTATATTAGDVAGYLKDMKIAQGQSGTPILLSSTGYLSRTAAGATVYPVASTTAYRNTDGTGAETTSFAYTWFTGTVAVQSVTTSAPVVSAAQNGPGTADVTTDVYDGYGQLNWERDPAGFIHYAAFDNVTGAVTRTITDVDTSQTGTFTGLPSGWSTPSGGGLQLTSSFVVDALGRTVKSTDPNGNVTYTVYDDPNHTVRVYSGWNATTGTEAGPTVVVREDRGRSYTETLTMTAAPALSGTSGSYAPTGTEAISGVQSLSRSIIDKAGRVVENDEYASLAGTSYSTAPYLGVPVTNYNATLYGYDDLGRVYRTVDAVGTITDVLYDSLGRVTSTYVGTNDSTTDGEEYSPSNASAAANMTLVASSQYDANGVGDGNLTQTTTYPDTTAAHSRVTQYAYDWRDRLVAAKSGVQASEDTTTHRPILFYEYDNLDEVTAVSRFDGDGVTLGTSKPSATLLRAYATTSYDDQGRPYQSAQYSVNATTGAVSTSALTSNVWYDHRGNAIKTSSPGGLVAKSAYDGAGRETVSYMTDGGGDATWADAGNVTGDIVLTQAETTYDANSNPILVTTRDRFHDDLATATGALGTPSFGVKARVSYSAAYYDSLDRLTASVDVGTAGGLGYARPATAPATSDTTLVTSLAYDSAGRPSTVTDPRGIVTRTSYDMLGQAVQTITAYDPATNGGLPTATKNGTTNYTYDGVGHVTTVQAVMPAGTPSQTTAYVYGVNKAGGGLIASNDLLARLELPDPSTGSPSLAATNQDVYTYDASGEVVTDTRPSGTVHTYGYDVLGRRVVDAATTLGTGVDGAVRRLETAYDTAGRAFLFTSYDAVTGGNVVNQVEDVFNGLGQLTGQYQAQSGAVNTATTPEVQYAYTEMSGGQNNSRLTSMTYPNGRKVDYVYNAGLDSSISRLSAIADDSGGTPSTTLEAYSYLGLGTIVRRAHPQPGIDLTYIQQAGDAAANSDGGDQYTGLDRFGRVIDQNWVKTADGSHPERFQYGYDRNGDRLYRANLVNTSQGELYRANSTTSGDSNTAYDPMGRLTAFARGTLSSSGRNGAQPDTIASPSHSQSYSLDALGDFSGVTTDGTTASRTFNAQDQATSASGGGSAAPTFDADGNTIGTGHGAYQMNVGSTVSYVYDAWDRLVAVKNGPGTASPGYPIGSYAYDALGRRIAETNAQNAGLSSHLYYSASWQVIEERSGVNTPSSVTWQYVWGAAYVDGLVLRDSYSGGTQNARVYALTDAQYDVTSVVNASGVVQERYEYDPYGSVTYLDASWASRSGSSLSWQYLHQGGRLDAMTGWYGFRNRDLIASEMRWAERDPLGLAAGDANQYRNVGNDPTDTVDPTGLWGDHWFDNDWSDWINPFAWAGCAGYKLGDRIGTGWATAAIKDRSLSHEVYEKQREKLQVDLADPDTALDASVTFMRDHRRIDYREVEEQITDALLIADGVVASVELALEVVSIVDGAMLLKDLSSGTARLTKRALGALYDDYWNLAGGVSEQEARALAKSKGFGFDFGRASRFANERNAVIIGRDKLKDGLINRLELAEEIQHGLDKATNEMSRFMNKNKHRNLTLNRLNELFHAEHFERIIKNWEGGDFQFLSAEDIDALRRVVGQLKRGVK